MLGNILVIIILVLVIGAAVLYLCRAKRRGETCVGCPYAKQCANKKAGQCGGNRVQGTKHK